MKCHIGMAVFYGCLFGFVIAMLDRTISSASYALAVGFFSVPVLLHLVLSYGSFRRFELSRKASEVVFALLLLAFPIGTLLSMFLFLPATGWKTPDDSKT